MRILEAMAMGLPIVSTSIGAEGITATDAQGLLIADSVEEFARNVLHFVKKPDLARQIGLNARNYIEQNYSVQTTIKVIFDAYNDILSS